MCVKKIEGGKKVQRGDVEMDEEAVVEPLEEHWSLYCSLSPLGAKLLSGPVSTGNIVSSHLHML